MKTTVLAAALLVATFGLAPLVAQASPSDTATVPQDQSRSDNVPPPQNIPYPGTMKVHVDATDVDHRIFTVHESIPVKAGPMYLLYPQWIPGDHEPSGPIDKVASLVIRANGKVLTWKRDKYNVYAFHIDVPAGASSIDVDFQVLTAQKRSEGPIRMTPEMLDLAWSKVSMYPAGYYTRQIMTEPSVTVPAGWKIGSALRPQSQQGDTTNFKPISYVDLVDSPVIAGKYFKRIELDPGSKLTPMYLDVIADAPKDLVISPEAMKALHTIPAQYHKLYGAFHFNHYDFLLWLSDKMSGKGLEHHRSSEDGTGADFFTKWNLKTPHDLLTHELNHSWDGKYRRPADLWTPNFNVPMGDSLLWVYEGQTQFWGNVMAVRTGLENTQTGLDKLAYVAATYDMGRPGLLSWRTIEDTTNDPVMAQRAPLAYRNYQGSEDYYSAGQLIWLAVDAKLRALSHDKHSLDDFARGFFGVDPGAWNINTYTFQDVVSELNKIQPYDWSTFLRTRLDGHQKVTDGIAAEGWKLVYTDKQSDVIKALMAEYHIKGIDLTYSVGFSTSGKGSLRDVLWNGPAFKAGLAPGMTIVAVDGQEFNADNMKQAVKNAQNSSAPITLMVKNFDEYKTIKIDYHGGLKYPHLVRVKGTPDYLSQLYAVKK
ncbi:MULTISPECIES: M61 family metallopeptidase [Rhodanobacter]|uniref:Predicted metalloprotease, contains C-terminal PDZ domain n=1 Tax=Rhodanobacter glycinis TaxID=582702 RepID=A0A1I4BKW8_9GAMM|nr:MULTISPECIES: M61 family metallopeptidase [Rhodanobacter]EIM00741.1 putative protease with the C-terminal PDZ domain [Rhodanobacter sp. 115]SFK69375.1 Predicted metalloprotease, contains C-terminal PDZ domain [Rhodanobacter glycinis]